MKEPLGIYLVYALCIDGSQTLKNLLENWLFFDSSFIQTSGSLRGLESGPYLKPTGLSFVNINFFPLYFRVTPQSELSHGLQESVGSFGLCPVFTSVLT
jgi:hypothetical protein